MLEFQTLSAPDLRDPEISSLIAAKMWEFHDLHMPGPKNVILWNRLRYTLIHHSKVPLGGILYDPGQIEHTLVGLINQSN